MAIAITNIGTGNAGGGATCAITVGVGGVPSGAIIVLGASEKSSSTIGGSVADSGSNGYGSITSAFFNNTSSNGFGNVFYSTTGNALVSTNTITYTKQTSGNSTVTSAVYVTGAATSNPLDTSVTNSATGSSSTPTVTSGTPSVSGEMFIGYAGGLINTSFTEDSGNGWSTPPNSVIVASPIAIGGGSQVNAGTGTKTFAPTFGNSGAWAIFVIGFSPPIVITYPQLERGMRGVSRGVGLGGRR